jgi:hypothetical protein
MRGVADVRFPGVGTAPELEHDLTFIFVLVEEGDAGTHTDGVACLSGKFVGVRDVVNGLYCFLEVFVYLVIANILWLPFWVDVEGHGVFGYVVAEHFWLRRRMRRAARTGHKAGFLLIRFCVLT